MSDLTLDPITATESAVTDTAHELHHLHDIDLKKLLLDIVRNKKQDTQVRSVILDGGFEESIEATPTIDVTIHDPDWDLLNSGALDGAVDVKIGHRRWYRLNDIEVTDDQITLTFITRNAAYMSYHTKHKKATRRAGRHKPKDVAVTRAGFIYMLARSVKIVTIPFFCPQLHVAQDVLKPDVTQTKSDRERRKSGLPNDGSVKSKRQPADEEQLKVIEEILRAGHDMKAPRRALVYAVMCTTQENNNRVGNTTNTSAPIGAFQQFRFLNGKRSSWPATGVPYKDAKGFFKYAIKYSRQFPSEDYGVVIDKIQRSGNPYAYDTWRDEAEKTIKQWQGGGGGKSLHYAKQYEYETLKDADGEGHAETYLAAAYRLASEVNWRVFWIRDEMNVQSEEDLFKGKVRMTLDRNTPGLEGVQVQWGRQQKVESMTLRVRMEKWVAPVGSVVKWDEGSVDIKGKYLVKNIRRRFFDQMGEIVLGKPLPELPEPAHEVGSRDVSSAYDGGIDDTGGARGIVDSAVQIASAVTKGGTKVVSDYRPGSVTTSGNTSDHSRNDQLMAARDISQPGIDALTGPPTHNLDKAAVAIGKAFNKNYKSGETIIDSFHWQGFRIQIIWRTPQYGGHMGHIHVGAKALSLYDTRPH